MVTVGENVNDARGVDIRLVALRAIFYVLAASLVFVATYFFLNHSFALADLVAFLVALVFGAYLSGFRGSMDNVFIEYICKVDKVKIDAIFYSKPGNVECFGDYFVYLIYAIILVYILANCSVVMELQKNGVLGDTNVASYAIASLAAMLAICALAFVTARYAGYIRLISIFDRLCINYRELSELSLGDDKIHSGDLRKMRKTVFRLQTLNEPPGNIFVTIGITGTFLGLALGLTTIPLAAMANPDNTSAQKLLLALPFIRSMGLALGVSTTGVIAAIAAHVLRGRGGPSSSIEDLLSDAKKLVDGAAASPRTN